MLRGSERCFNFVSLSHTDRLHFLQDGDLPRMVELMLRHSMQHEVEIVFLPRNPLAQARSGKAATVFTSASCVRFASSDGFAPRRFE